MFIYLFTLLLIQVPNRKCYHHQGKQLHLTTFQTNNSSINRTINFSIPSYSKSIPNWDWHFTLCEVNKFSITETIFFECPSSSSTLVGIATPYHWVSYGPSSPPFIQSAHPSTENPFCPTFQYEIARNWSSFCVNMENKFNPLRSLVSLPLPPFFPGFACLEHIGLPRHKWVVEDTKNLWLGRIWQFNAM